MVLLRYCARVDLSDLFIFPRLRTRVDLLYVCQTPAARTLLAMIQKDQQAVDRLLGHKDAAPSK